jgi:LacI family kdg operon repressor
MNKFKEENVTIAQVAAAANVSRTTVSRYLNGKFDYMSAKTRQRIHNIILQMDYHPSNIARSLKSQVSKSIGCIIADISSPFSSILLKGINHICNSNGYQVLFSDIDNNPEKERNAIKEFLANQVDGLIVNTTGWNDDFLIDLKEKGVPIVLADRSIAAKDKIDTVSIENYDSTYLCMRHLFQNGFERVAFFTPGNEKISPRILRYQAFLDAMSAFYHIDGRQFTYETGGDSADGSAKQLSCFLDRNQGKKLAIFCVNGVALINVLEAMQQVGCVIGPQLGICGFDDWGWAKLIPPGITTIMNDSYSVGAESAKILLRRISNKRKVKPVLVELESCLCVRGSTDQSLARNFVGWNK